MTKVRSLEHRDSLTLPIGTAASVRLTGFRSTPTVLLELRGPLGGDLGALMLPKPIAQLLAGGLMRVADGAPLDDVVPPRAPQPDATLLTTTLDPEATLTRFARLAVPVFADWCSIDLARGDHPPRRLAVAHADARKVKAARTLARYAHDPRRENPRSVVWNTGRPDVAVEVPDERLVAGAHDQAHLDLLRALRVRSSLVVPIMSGGQVGGVFTFAVAESGRQYSGADLPTALLIAHCAELAMENARLFREAQGFLHARVGGLRARRTRTKAPGNA